MAAPRPFPSLVLTQEIRPLTEAFAGGSVLGAICYGDAALLDASGGHDPTEVVQHVAAPVLEEAGAPSCLWRALASDRPVRAGSAGRIRFRTDGTFLFGLLEMQDLTEAGGGLRTCAETAYAEIFRLLGSIDAPREPRLWRVWNYMADIHGSEEGLERYRQFNAGRSDAFRAHWAARTGGAAGGGIAGGDIPAACGIGTIGAGARPGLSVGFLASALPFVQIENPRQVSAYRYPVEYGPRSPIFSRAILGPSAEAAGRSRPYLFLSGTASIVGHETLHAGDLAGQCQETVRNLEALAEEANREMRRRDLAPIALEDLDYLVYLRRPQDLSAAREVLVRALGSRARMHFVHADICRSDLLVEIEAILLERPGTQ